MFNMVIAVFLKEFLLFKIHLEMFTDKVMTSGICLRIIWKGDGAGQVEMKHISGPAVMILEAGGGLHCLDFFCV